MRWVGFDRETGELRPEDVAAELSGADPPRRRHRRVQPAGYPTGPARDRPTSCTPVTRCSSSTGCTSYPHAAVDQAALGADFLVCSPYKFFGPHCGVLTARPELLETLQPDKLLPSSDAVPDRFELGHAAVRADGRHDRGRRLHRRALTEATGSRRERVLASMEVVEAHEDALRRDLESRLADSTGWCCTAAPPSAPRPCCSRCRAATRPRVSERPGRGRGQRAGRVVLRARGGPLDGTRCRRRHPGGHRAVHRRRDVDRLVRRRPAGARAVGDGGRASGRAATPAPVAPRRPVPGWPSPVTLA